MIIPGSYVSKEHHWGVSGIDYSKNQEDYYEMILTAAWHTAYNPWFMIWGTIGPPSNLKFIHNDLPVAKLAKDVGIALNSGSARSVHQVTHHQR
jgi:hypothetical protein